jgi:hypothetical protein
MGALFGRVSGCMQSRRVVVATAEVWVASSACCRVCWVKAKRMEAVVTWLWG